MKNKIKEAPSTSLDVREDLIKRLLSVVPEAETDGMIDWDKLKQELTGVIDESPERYNFTWNGKKQAMRLAQQPTTATLKPNKGKSKNWDTTENLYIEGDNFEVLKTLQKTYSNRIKLIYVDPPYNTGNDIIYPNNFALDIENYLEFSKQVDKQGNILSTNTETNGRYHTDWLDMMYTRLKLARNLLRDDGVMILAIDHNELANLIKISDEIMGEKNRIGIVSVVHKPEGRNQAKYFGPSNEFMLVYTKSQNSFQLRSVVLDPEEAKKFDKRDETGKYYFKNFIRLADGKYATKEAKPEFWYPIFIDEDTGGISTVESTNKTEVYPITIQGVERTWKTVKNTAQERIDKGELIAVKRDGRWIIQEKMRENQVFKTHWISKRYHAYHFGTKILDDLLKVKSFDFPKSLYLLKDIVKMTTEKEDIILDLFSGSSTMAHAVMEQNLDDEAKRKYIMIQLPEALDDKNDAFREGYQTIPEIAQERIRRAGDKIVDENPLFAGDLDIGFKVFELDKSNIKKWNLDTTNLEEQMSMLEDNFEEGSKPLDVVYEIMLKQGLDLSYPVEEVNLEDTFVYNVGFGALFVVLGNNINSGVASYIIDERNRFERENTVVAFQDQGFESDSEKLNIIEILNANGIKYYDIFSI